MLIDFSALSWFYNLGEVDGTSITRDVNYFDGMTETWITYPDLLDQARFASAVFIVSRDICNWG